MLAKLLPKKTDFFGLFSRHVELTVEAARSLEAMLDQLGDAEAQSTRIRSLEPSPASWARAPSWLALQMFTFAQLSVSWSEPTPCAGIATAAAPRNAPSAKTPRLRHLRAIERSLAASPGDRHAAYQTRHMAFDRPAGSPP